MKKMITIVFSCLLLSACKIEFSPTVNLSDLNSKTPKTVPANLIIDVATCYNNEESTIESTSLIRAKRDVVRLFNNAKFIACNSEKKEAKASFDVPITVGGSEEFGDIQIANADFGGGMTVRISKNLKDKISNRRSNFSQVSPTIIIKIKNDLGKPQNVVLHSVYFSNHATVLSPAIFQHGNIYKLKLSDVSKSEILDNGITLVYEDFDKPMPIEIK